MMIDYTLLRVLGIVSILQIWWVAVWGVCYMGIDYITRHTIITEFWVYLGMLLSIYLLLGMNPELVKYIASI